MYIPCYSAPAVHWSLLHVTRLASRIILIEQNIKKRTGPAFYEYSLLGLDYLYQRLCPDNGPLPTSARARRGLIESPVEMEAAKDEPYHHPKFRAVQLFSQVYASCPGGRLQCDVLKRWRSTNFQKADASESSPLCQGTEDFVYCLDCEQYDLGQAAGYCL